MDPALARALIDDGLENGWVKQDRAQLVLLGDKGVGKTAMVARLRGMPHGGNFPTTVCSSYELGTGSAWTFEHSPPGLMRPLLQLYPDPVSTAPVPTTEFRATDELVENFIRLRAGNVYSHMPTPAVRFRVWDFSGDPVFRPLVRMLLPQNAVYMIMHDVSDGDFTGLWDWTNLLFSQLVDAPAQLALQFAVVLVHKGPHDQEASVELVLANMRTRGLAPLVFFHDTETSNPAETNSLRSELARMLSMAARLGRRQYPIRYLLLAQEFYKIRSAIDDEHLMMVAEKCRIGPAQLELALDHLVRCGDVVRYREHGLMLATNVLVALVQRLYMTSCRAPDFTRHGYVDTTRMMLDFGTPVARYAVTPVYFRALLRLLVEHGVLQTRENDQYWFVHRCDMSLMPGLERPCTALPPPPTGPPIIVQNDDAPVPRPI